MRTTNDIDLAVNLDKYVGSIANGGEPIILDCGGNKGIVIISLEEYNSLKRNEYLLSQQGKNKQQPYPSEGSSSQDDCKP